MGLPSRRRSGPELAEWAYPETAASPLLSVLKTLLPVPKWYRDLAVIHFPKRRAVALAIVWTT